MIFVFVDLLQEQFGVHIPAVFQYSSTRMILAAVTTLLLSIFLGPYFIKTLYEWKIGQQIRREECPVLAELHGKKQDTPTMGGVLILFSMLISLFLWMDLTNVFTLLLLFSTLVLGLLGAWDDFRKLRYKNAKGVTAKQKLVVQGSVAVVIAAYLLVPAISQGIHQKGWFAPPTAKNVMVQQIEEEKILSLKDYSAQVYLPFKKDPLLEFDGWGRLAAALFIVFVIVGSSNAVNLTDGLDGLAAGSIILVAATFALFAFVSNNLEIARYLNILYIEGSGEIAIYLCAVAGACLGFLWYNGHPAQVFMGDTGSLALGGVLGVSAVLLRKEFLLAIVGGIFLAEAFSVVLQVVSFRFRNKKRVFLCAPLHHHFEYKGWPETKVVLRFWIIGLLLALLGLASLKFQ